MVHIVQLTGSVPKMPRINNPTIEFSEDNARRLHNPHDDALVVSLQIGDYNMHRVLVDNGSSADILYYPAFQQMRIDREQLTQTNAPLVRFEGTKVFPLGTITLFVTAGDYPQQITRGNVSRSRLLVCLQCHSRMAHSQFLEGGDFNIPFDN